ncbi:hypothetical protein EG359_05870 [Chryseobacterium joostei]|uniref:Uncharacterized protein n=1 Tax=Chryseobacterium joostei TaxID=112234 RepID=A0A1N7HTI5_9FLAO|nr:hypothetical protein [Chryseobacterium joostei]AZA99158.1 hypothetical protein EG359_05870 [Chryseobacterium joostei]SIS28133.1 hypothetical protein SAMN05421768_101184 [Chryseobacterium joostei]
MKSLRITLGVAAIAIGSFAAFSFAPANTLNEDETGIFYANPDGSMGDPVGATNECKLSGPICSQEYDLDTELPTNNHIVRGVRQP